MTLLFLAGTLAGCVSAGEPPGFDHLWNYSDPAASRASFEKRLQEEQARGDPAPGLRTQIARTYSLEGNFAEAHRILDRIRPELDTAGPEVKVRYLLERGRTFRSAGKGDMALPLFREARAVALRQGPGYLAVDAIHMLAIAEKDSGKRAAYTREGIALAKGAEDPRTRRWLGPLHNNLGWDLHGQRRYAKALIQFEQALDAYRKTGRSGRIFSARWAVARAQRSLGRTGAALAIQLDLLKEMDKTRPDGYVYEELGELYLLNGEKERAGKYFGQAYQILSSDKWLLRNEPERLARLKRLSVRL